MILTDTDSFLSFSARRWHYGCSITRMIILHVIVNVALTSKRLGASAERALIDVGCCGGGRSRLRRQQQRDTHWRRGNGLIWPRAAVVRTQCLLAWNRRYEYIIQQIQHVRAHLSTEATCNSTSHSRDNMYEHIIQQRQHVRVHHKTETTCTSTSYNRDNMYEHIIQQR